MTIRPRRVRRALASALVLLLLVVASAAASSVTRLRLPEPSGPHAVGRQSVVLADPARGEPSTPDESDLRRVPVTAWYPAVPGTGDPAAYVENLDRIADALVASGAVGGLEVAGLRLVTDRARSGAEPADIEAAFPVLILSPGNATNVQFYAGLAEDLASQGYVVIGVDHPGQVAAVDTGEGVIPYAGDPPMSDAEAIVRDRISERVADVRFVIGRLDTDGAGIADLVGRLDLDRLGVMGHSNGGITAMAVCDDPEVRACANLDGQLGGGPLGVAPGTEAPDNPFLFLTKERSLHPSLEDRFQAAGRSAYRVVVPGASHGDFTDGAAFEPRVLPLEGMAEHLSTVTRGFVRAFFDHALLGASRAVFGTVTAPTDVLVVEYPVATAPSGG